MRNVLITGASRGIGAAIATQFAAAGDRVAIHPRDSAQLATDLAAELNACGPTSADHVVVQADLADPQAVLAMVDEAVAQLGGLDVLVNNAGIFFHHPITEVSYADWQEQWQATIGVNLIGAANVPWRPVRPLKQPASRTINLSPPRPFPAEPA